MKLLVEMNYASPQMELSGVNKNLLRAPSRTGICRTLTLDQAVTLIVINLDYFYTFYTFLDF